MSKLPWFPFYASDFLTSTGSMSNEEVGAYIKLLCHQWDKGVLPKDPVRLARLAGCDRIATALRSHRFGISFGITSLR
jgi:uncharacterized protein YdaU (DUF1376 family)